MIFFCCMISFAQYCTCEIYHVLCTYGFSVLCSIVLCALHYELYMYYVIDISKFQVKAIINGAFMIIINVSSCGTLPMYFNEYLGSALGIYF